MLRAWGIGIQDLAKTDDSQDDGDEHTAADIEIKDSKADPAYLTVQQIAEAPSQRTVTIVCVTRPFV